MAEQKYRVIKRLEAGGMAEVFVGEAVSVQGFKKQVAIKRVLPHLAQNQDFIEMFLDEARLSARLTHANIVSVFDISAREDTYFLIMEFVDGANLKKIIEGVQSTGKRLPLAAAIFICIEACRGLSYAHELVGDDGQPLGIVHRDISPPNIMVTRRGEVKVADFGLAKAGTQLAQTDPGVVKGKFSYLSPEAAQGEDVDARSDIFALGVVLWEMLAGRRLFMGDTDYATVKLVQQANIPRLAPLNHEVDEEFEEVLLRALARDTGSRFQSARDFGDALSGYLYERQLKVTSYEIAQLVQKAINEDTSGTGSGSGLSPTSTTDGSLIGRLIQEELDESVGISSEPEEDAAAAEAAAGFLGGEDPRSWFDEDDLAHLSGPPPAMNDGDKDPPSGAWRETGAAKDSSPPPLPHERGEASAPHAPSPPQPEVPSAPVPAAATAQEQLPAAAPQAAAATGQSSGGPGKFLIAALLAVALAAVAWFGTRM